MLKTPLCDLFGIEVPIILAPMGSLFRTTAAIKRDIDMVRKLQADLLRSTTFRKHWTPRRFATRSRHAQPWSPSRSAIRGIWCGRPTMSDRS
jgi:hypothetical protein